MYRHHRLAEAAVSAFLILFSAAGAHAAKLTKVKGDQVLIDLEGESAQYGEGSRHLVMVDGKRKAVVEISKVKGEKAIGKVLKGTVSEGATLAPLQISSSSPSSETATPTHTANADRPRSHRKRSKRSSLFSGLTVGATGTYGIASQNVSTNILSASMTGSSYGLKAFGDYPISGDFGLLGRFGFENFAVAGTSQTQGNVTTSILYADADLLIRYHFLEGNFHPFPLLGLGLHLPLSKSSNVLDINQITPTTIFFIGGGVNYVLSDSMYIHATVEYGYFPPSSQVTTSLIDLRAGLGIQL